MSAQKISGYLYDSDGILTNFKIRNASQQSYSETNEKGFFEISAKIGDRIIFNSMLYEKYALIVKESDFKNNIVIELNFYSLEEVKLNSGKSFKTDPENLDDLLSTQIKNDIKNNPLAYRPSNGNLLEIPKLIFGLLSKKKAKKITNTEKVLNREDFETLFNEDQLFTKEFLVEDLKIPMQYHQLFFEYLATKNYTSSLLQHSQKLELIAKLQEAAEKYRTHIISEEQ